MRKYAYLDGEALGELLTYLVVSQLIARARTSGWLQPVHFVESERLWLASNGGQIDWTTSLDMAQLSRSIADRVLQLPPFRDESLLATLFTDGWRLDYRLPLVRCLNSICVEDLLRFCLTGNNWA